MTKPQFRELPRSALMLGPNIREIAVDEELKELGQSLSRQGFLAPVGAVEEGSQAVLFYGFRRIHAYDWAMDEGFPMPETVPVLLYSDSLSAVERDAITLVENTLRADLNDVQLFHAVKSLAGKGLTLEVIGTHINKSKGTVSKWLSPDRCPEEAQAAFLAGRLSLGQMYQISTLPDQSGAMRAFLRGESQEATRRAGRKVAAGPSDGPKEKTPRVTIPLAPADNSGSLGVVTITAKPGQEFDWDGAERLLREALRMVKEAERKGLAVKSAQTGWKALASAKPLAEATH